MMGTRATVALSHIIGTAALLSLATSACTESTFVLERLAVGISQSADSLVSDGSASVLITAELPPSLPQDATIEFNTTLGRWTNTIGASERKVTVQAHGGMAQARLFSGGEVGTAYVTVNAAGTTAQTTVELTPSRPEIIDLFVDRTAAPADGTTAVTATAILRRGTGTVSRGTPVRFEVRDSATGAALSGLGGVIVADSASTARLRITSRDLGTVLVRAFAAGVESDTRTVRFTPPPAATLVGGTAALVTNRAVSHPLFDWRHNE